MALSRGRLPLPCSCWNSKAFRESGDLERGCPRPPSPGHSSWPGSLCPWHLPLPIMCRGATTDCQPGHRAQGFVIYALAFPSPEGRLRQPPKHSEKDRLGTRLRWTLLFRKFVPLNYKKKVCIQCYFPSNFKNKTILMEPILLECPLWTGPGGNIDKAHSTPGERGEITHSQLVFTRRSPGFQGAGLALRAPDRPRSWAPGLDSQLRRGACPRCRIRLGRTQL